LRRNLWLPYFKKECFSKFKIPSQVFAKVNSPLGTGNASVAVAELNEDDVEVKVLQQMGEAACVFGVTVGVTRNGFLWVANGCRLVIS
jgi:hypothetical protein